MMSLMLQFQQQKMKEANGEIFNVGSGVATTVKEVAETLKNFYGSVININISGKFPWRYQT